MKIEYADVAELADALASGASECKFMWVRLPSSAPITRFSLLREPGDFFNEKTGVEVGAGVKDRPADGQSRERPSRAARRESTPVIRTISSVHKGVHL